MPIFSSIRLQPGVVVEFSGAEGTGKTELLLNIAALCILPQSCVGVKLPGCSVDVMYIATSCELEIMRLVAVMESILLSHGVTSAHCKDLITESLERLHVMKCNTMDELALTLYLLKIYVKNHPEVCMLLVDNITTFWWMERVTYPTKSACLQTWIPAIKELIRELHVVVIATKQVFTKDKTDGHQIVTNYYK